ncbi:MAG: response regulator, partial [Chloroflexota bacterium]
MSLSPDSTPLYPDVRSATILIIDDTPTNLGVIVEYLEDYGFEILVARNGEIGLQRAKQASPDLILLDVMMPGIDGFETCHRLKSDPALRDIPVIFMTSLSDTEHKIKGFEVGGVDYITKPIQQSEVLARITTHLRIQTLTKNLQSQNNHLQHMMDVLFKRTVQLETSSQVGKQVTSILDLDELLGEVVKLVQLNFEYHFVGVWLANPKEENVILQARAGDIDPLPTLGLSITYAQKDNAVAWVRQHGDHILIEDTKVHPEYSPLRQLSTGQSELVLPLLAGEETIGALDILSNRPSRFEGEERVMLQSVANQIAIAIRNAQLYQAEQLRRQQIAELNEYLEQKVAERTEDLNKAYLALSQIDKTKSHFIQVTSHELRTPLTVIKGYSQLLQTSAVAKDESTQSFLGELLKGIDRLHEIVNTMFDVAKIDSRVLDIRQDPTDLVEIIDEVKDKFEEALQDRSLLLTINDLTTLPQVIGNPDLLVKVFNNLLINAIKYTPDNGKITISGQVVTLPEIETPFAEVVVSDTGIGIDPEHQ